jgi:hypothetical protein
VNHLREQLRKVYRTTESMAMGNLYDTAVWGVFVDGIWHGYVSQSSSGKISYQPYGSYGTGRHDFRDTPEYS